MTFQFLPLASFFHFCFIMINTIVSFLINHKNLFGFMFFVIHVDLSSTNQLFFSFCLECEKWPDNFNLYDIIRKIWVSLYRDWPYYATVDRPRQVTLCCGPRGRHARQISWRYFCIICVGLTEMLWHHWISDWRVENQV